MIKRSILPTSAPKLYCSICRRVAIDRVRGKERETYIQHLLCRIQNLQGRSYSWYRVEKYLSSTSRRIDPFGVMNISGSFGNANHLCAWPLVTRGERLLLLYYYLDVVPKKILHISSIRSPCAINGKRAGEVTRVNQDLKFRKGSFPGLCLPNIFYPV